MYSALPADVGVITGDLERGCELRRRGRQAQTGVARPQPKETTMTTDAFRSHAAATQAEINVTPLIDVLLALVVIHRTTCDKAPAASARRQP